MSTEQKIVYYEDVEVSATRVKSDGTKEASVTSKSVSKSNSSSTSAPLKRQRTLMEMMPGASKEPTTTGQPAKKAKLSTSASPDGPSSSPAKAVTFGLQPLNFIPFSMTEFKDSLTEEQRNLLLLECETMGKSWLKVLKDEIKKSYFIQLKKFLWSEGVKGPYEETKEIFPAPRNIYAWSHTPLGRVRVVIIGQDPYHGPGQAHGLCFSVPHGVPVPPSLRNIYAEIKAEYPDFAPPKHGLTTNLIRNLSAWAKSGVLLLNTALTVRCGKAASHSNKGWETFTDKVIEVVDKYGGSNLGDTNGVSRGIVFMAWGAPAAKRVAKLDKKKHLILQSAHPSPLSVHRGFRGNGHFKKANVWLEDRYGKDGLIDWCKLEVEEDVQGPASSQ